MKKVCVFCGDDFETKHCEGRYCSKRCASLDTREERSKLTMGQKRK